MNIEQALIAALGLLCAALSYWAVRLESNVTAVAAKLHGFEIHVAEQYVHKDDCRLTHSDMHSTLSKIEDKLDRLIERKLP